MNETSAAVTRMGVAPQDVSRDPVHLVLTRDLVHLVLTVVNRCAGSCSASPSAARTRATSPTTGPTAPARALMLLDARMAELRAEHGLRQEDLNLDLDALGTLHPRC